MKAKLKQAVVEIAVRDRYLRQNNDTFDVDRQSLIENAARKQTVIDLILTDQLVHSS